MSPDLLPGMVPCTVETHCTAWLVPFEDGSDLLLQCDYDQAAFAVCCGVIAAPHCWDGMPSKLGEPWLALDPADIDQCPDDYLTLARLERGSR